MAPTHRPHTPEDSRIGLGSGHPPWKAALLYLQPHSLPEAQSSTLPASWAGTENLPREPTPAPTSWSLPPQLCGFQTGEARGRQTAWAGPPCYRICHRLGGRPLPPGPSSLFTYSWELDTSVTPWPDCTDQRPRTAPRPAWRSAGLLSACVLQLRRQIPNYAPAPPPGPRPGIPGSRARACQWDAHFDLVVFSP